MADLLLVSLRHLRKLLAGPFPSFLRRCIGLLINDCLIVLGVVVQFGWLGG